MRHLLIFRVYSLLMQKPDFMAHLLLLNSVFSQKHKKHPCKFNTGADNNLIAMVTYRCPETGDEVKFIINYNIYTVKVTLSATESYTLGKYDFVRIDG